MRIAAMRVSGAVHIVAGNSYFLPFMNGSGKEAIVGFRYDALERRVASGMRFKERIWWRWSLTITTR